MHSPPVLTTAAFVVALVTMHLATCAKPTADERGEGRGPEEAISAQTLPEPVPGSVQSRSLAARARGDAGDGGALFQRVPASASGLDFVHRWAPRSKSERDLIATAFAGGAVALGDLDHDGLPEIFLTRPQGGSRLYRNLGGFRFQDITAEVGMAGELAEHWSSGATFVDIEGDGDLDLYVCAYGMPNKLFVNGGAGDFFAERAAAFGLAFSGASVMMSFADYDRDGDLDAHLLTNRLSGGARPDGIAFQIVEGAVITPEPYRDEAGALLKQDGSLHPFDAGQADRLYRYDREEGIFTEVGESAGLVGHSHGLSATWWDYDSDGWIDLYVANDFFGPDHLYHNNRDGSFRDVIAAAVPNTPWFSMGSDAGDLNGDGRLDFIATDMAATTHYKQKVNMGDMDAEGWFLELPTPRQYMRNAVYVNTGTPRFLEAAQMAGLSASDWTWAVRIADFDCDGRNDVFFSNGMTRDFFHADVRAKVREISRQTGENRWSDYPPLKERNRLYRNRGGLQFEDRSREWGFDKDTVSFGAATGDLDGDGDLDLVVNNFEEAVGLYRNAGEGGEVIKIALHGADGNRQAIGAEVRVRTGQREQIRVLQPVRGFLGCDPAEVVFGLGEATVVDVLTVRWPSGKEQVWKELESGRTYRIAEAGESNAIVSSLAPPTLFVDRGMPAAMRHRERAFDDFALQPLLPNRLSLLGPAMAWGDIDGNGRLDCFLGGASGYPAQLWLQSSAGKLFQQRIPFFDEAAQREDVDAALFDADADGDLDLYVVSGGVEGVTGSVDYADRLYLSVANGLSVAPAGAVPKRHFSGGCVAVGDLEGDGDPDLFVGSRVIPGRYPLAGPSQLLRNEGLAADGQVRFSDVTMDLAAPLAETGMATDAVWADVDGDADLDLMVTTEYGPVKCYRNAGGRLVDATVAAGLADRRGWWTSIAAADIDGDGDSDFAVGNFGWNTKYHPTPERPQMLYYGDFEGLGKAHIIEAHPDGAGMVPNRGRSCSSGAMAFIGEKFATFHDFAVADLTEIYAPSRLASAVQLQANELASGILLNDGGGRFAFHPLPALAQIAPSLGLVFLDANGDREPDLYLSQNFYGPQRETGRMAGGVGLLLLGKGDGDFRVVEPSRSGIVISGDARGAAALDLNGDGAEDLAVAVNSGAVRVLLRRDGGAGGASDANE